MILFGQGGTDPTKSLNVGIDNSGVKATISTDITKGITTNSTFSSVATGKVQQLPSSNPISAKKILIGVVLAIIFIIIVSKA